MCRILVPQPEIEPAPFAVKCGFLTIGPPGESHHRTPLNCHHALESESGSCNPVDYSLPGSSVRGILQARRRE